MWLFDRRLISNFDFPLLLVGLLIPLLALIVIYSAGFDPEAQISSLFFFFDSIKSPAFIKQATFVGVGVGAMLLALSIETQKLARFSYALYTIGLVLLAVVLVMGRVSHGASRWLSIGGFNLQPSEPMKIALILTMARYLSRKELPRGGLGFFQLIVPGLIILLPMGLIVEQPDLGTSISLGAIGFMMLLFVGVKPKTLIILGALVSLAVIPIWHYYLLPYQQERVMNLLNPASDPQGTGYHINQSKIAVGSGQLVGKGFLKGTQTQLQFLPEHTTDFIFSVLAEEWGFFGSVLILFLYASLIYLILRSVLRCKDLFGALVCFGVAVWIFFHTVINIGMVIGIFPVVGITLPLFSYGGSSIVSLMFSIGLVLGINMRRFMLKGG